jgi:hypothetical protein
VYLVVACTKLKVLTSECLDPRVGTPVWGPCLSKAEAQEGGTLGTATCRGCVCLGGCGFGRPAPVCKSVKVSGCTLLQGTSLRLGSLICVRIVGQGRLPLGYVCRHRVAHTVHL